MSLIIKNMSFVMKLTKIQNIVLYLSHKKQRHKIRRNFKMICGECGRKLKSRAVFCNVCGGTAYRATFGPKKRTNLIATKNMITYIVLLGVVDVLLFTLASVL